MEIQVAAKIHGEFTKHPQRKYPKGQILVFADEDPEHVFYLVTGKVRQYDVSYRGDEVIVNIFKPPAFFPMSWAINHTPNRYFYKTEEPTTVHIVPAEVAVAFIRDNPDILFNLLSRVYSGMDGLLSRIVHLMSGTAKSRLIYELIIECRRFGKKQGNGRYLLTANQIDIAARSGLSRETVSREMQSLKDSGIVRVEHNGIVVEDLDRLEQQLGLVV